jgi:hypothetical protein
MFAWGNDELLSFGGKLRQAVSSRWEGRLYNRCQYAMGFKDGTIVVSENTICHAWLRDIGLGYQAHTDHYYFDDCVVVFNLIYPAKRLNPAPYYDYLLNRSPWSECYITKDVTTIAEGGVISRGGGDKWLTVSSCVALRFPSEHPDRLKTWLYLTQKLGVHEDKAMLLANRYNFDPKNKRLPYYIYNGNHDPVYTSQLTKQGVANFLDHRVGSDKQSLSRMWCDSGLNPPDHPRDVLRLKHVGTMPSDPYPYGPFRTPPPITPRTKDELKADIKEMFEKVEATNG